MNEQIEENGFCAYRERPLMENQAVFFCLYQCCLTTGVNMICPNPKINGRDCQLGSSIAKQLGIPFEPELKTVLGFSTFAF